MGCLKWAASSSSSMAASSTDWNHHPCSVACLLKEVLALDLFSDSEVWLGLGGFLWGSQVMREGHRHWWVGSTMECLSLYPLIALCLRVSLERESEPLYLLLYFNVMTPPCPWTLSLCVFWVGWTLSLLMPIWSGKLYVGSTVLEPSPFHIPVFFSLRFFSFSILYYYLPPCPPPRGSRFFFFFFVFLFSFFQLLITQNYCRSILLIIKNYFLID